MAIDRKALIKQSTAVTGIDYIRVEPSQGTGSSCDWPASNARWLLDESGATVINCGR